MQVNCKIFSNASIWNDFEWKESSIDIQWIQLGGEARSMLLERKEFSPFRQILKLFSHKNQFLHTSTKIWHKISKLISFMSGTRQMQQKQKVRWAVGGEWKLNICCVNDSAPLQYVCHSTFRTCRKFHYQKKSVSCHFIYSIEIV